MTVKRKQASFFNRLLGSLSKTMRRDFRSIPRIIGIANRIFQRLFSEATAFGAAYWHSATTHPEYLLAGQEREAARRAVARIPIPARAHEEIRDSMPYGEGRDAKDGAEDPSVREPEADDQPTRPESKRLASPKRVALT